MPGDLKPGQGRALTSKLEAALAAVERGNVNAALGQLHALENVIRAHRHTASDLADELLAAIAEIVEALDSY